MGQPLAFDYDVTLGPRDEGYPIRAQSLRAGRTATTVIGRCARISSRAIALLETIADETPLLGQPIADVLAWKRPAMGPGCYCERRPGTQVGPRARNDPLRAPR